MNIELLTERRENLFSDSERELKKRTLLALNVAVTLLRI